MTRTLSLSPPFVRVVATMSNAQIDESRHDRIHMYVSAETYAALEAKLRPGQAVDDLIESLLVDESTWPDVAEAIVSRELDVYPVVSCYAGPQYVGGDTVKCPCCPVHCRFAWHWRSQRRCGCTPERIALLGS